MRRKNRRNRLLLGLNIVFWSLAFIVWGMILFGEDPAAKMTSQLRQSDQTEQKIDPIIALSDAKGKLTHQEEGISGPLIAIIIDDFGPAWNQEIVDGFLELPYEITLSIIPGYPTSPNVSRAAKENRKETFIHLPMEPTESVSMNEPFMIMARDKPERIAHLLDEALKIVPDAVGVNNHMGSKATKDKTTMERLANALARNGLMFIDSRTVEKSKALAAMKKQRVMALGRDVFLDSVDDTLSPKERLGELEAIAQRRGWAIGIGHVKSATLSAISDELPEMERRGCRFISAGRLIHQMNENKIAKQDDSNIEMSAKR